MQYKWDQMSTVVRSQYVAVGTGRGARRRLPTSSHLAACRPCNTATENRKMLDGIGKEATYYPACLSKFGGSLCRNSALSTTRLAVQRCMKSFLSHLSTQVITAEILIHQFNVVLGVVGGSWKCSRGGSSLWAPWTSARCVWYLQYVLGGQRKASRVRAAVSWRPLCPF